MGIKNRRTGRVLKLMDFIIRVKPLKVSYASYKNKIVGAINIKSIKLKNSVNQEVRVIIYTKR